MPQGDKNDSEPGIIAGTAVYENEGFDGSHDGINGTDDSASYTTMNETSSLKYNHQIITRNILWFTQGCWMDNL